MSRGYNRYQVAAGEKRSFEFSEWIILGEGSRKIRIVIVYRLQYSPNHPVTTGQVYSLMSFLIILGL